jgi:citrate lyase subunit beta/citryl-CoA lyase
MSETTHGITAANGIRPPPLRRAWFFVPGMDRARQTMALESGADAVVADLEEMTTAEDRPEARGRIVTMLRHAAERGVLGAVRINKLEHCGLADLQGIMPGAPRAVFLPHSETAEQLMTLDASLTALEKIHGIAPGSTEIVPTIESAKGMVALSALLNASARIRCCMLAVEDLANNLGARRTPDGTELLYARSRFLMECIAADCTAIDLPCTYRSLDVLAADMDLSTQLGFTSKCVVFDEHVGTINAAYTPSEAEVAHARQVVAAHAAQTQNGGTGASPWIDSPDRNNAQRVIARAAAFADHAALTSR